jgi:hypothetical protein
MFERFSKGAREVVERAQAEGRALGHQQIGTTALLLSVAAGPGRAAHVLAEHGATRERLIAQAAGTEIDGEALAAIGIDLDEIRRRAEASFGPGALERGRRDRGKFVPFSPEAKKTLELALREAIAAGDREIGAEHVLLGLLREGGVNALLLGTGADPGAVRAELSPAASRRGRGG